VIISFGFDKGPPPTRATKVFDVRDLPHDTNSSATAERLAEIIAHGKANHPSVIAIGCAAGAHRSPDLANRASLALRTGVLHREK